MDATCRGEDDSEGGREGGIKGGGRGKGRRLNDHYTYTGQVIMLLKSA